MVSNGSGVSSDSVSKGGSLIVLLRLRPGWKLDPASASLQCLAADGSPIYAVPLPDLPRGAELLPAIPLRVPRRGKPLAAEHELERYLHLHLRLPTREPPEAWLARAREWEFVESARVLKGIGSV
ncbi:hypothetical protein BH11PSE9_BH11PSE9_07130 [soil metagenome]